MLNVILPTMELLKQDTVLRHETLLPHLDSPCDIYVTLICHTGTSLSN